jgi:hypothetical protein
MRILMRNKRILAGRNDRRGSAYLVVLGVSLIVAALAYGGILATRARSRIALEVADAAEARQYAFDAVEIAKQWISSDPNWRTTRPNGVWANNLAIGGGSCTIEGTDPADGNLANFPHDSVALKVTGRKGNSRHTVQVTFVARPEPHPALQYALHVAGQLHVLGGKTLHAGAATVSTNGTLNNGGTINGNVRALLALPAGTINGSLAIISGSVSVPDASIIDQYAAVGTQIATSSLDKQVLGPGVNPFGEANPNGIYVVRPGANFNIKSCRVLGTLVVICPSGKKVVIDEKVLLQAYRSDCPALIIQGDADIQFDGGDDLLDEKLIGISLNPPGAPYNGNTNNGKGDVFPSEIQGLVHVTGKVNLKKTSKIRGALFSNSTATLLSDAVAITDTPTIVYPTSLYTSPPCWYTTAVPMTVQRGSWEQK